MVACLERLMKKEEGSGHDYVLYCTVHVITPQKKNTYEQRNIQEGAKKNF